MISAWLLNTTQYISIREQVNWVFFQQIEEFINRFIKEGGLNLRSETVY